MIHLSQGVRHILKPALLIALIEQNAYAMTESLSEMDINIPKATVSESIDIQSEGAAVPICWYTLPNQDNPPPVGIVVPREATTFFCLTVFGIHESHASGLLDQRNALLRMMYRIGCVDEMAWVRHYMKHHTIPITVLSGL